MLDCSPRKIEEYRMKYDFDFWQLRTPLTRYKTAGVPYGLDNGCFTTFKRKDWLTMLGEAKRDKDLVKFVALPDVVESAKRTTELSQYFIDETRGLPRALVLQDGIGNVEIKWRQIEAVFIGGSDNFKISPEAFHAAKAAKILGKWVHVGRVNDVFRMNNWIHLADSIDGSGISKYDHMLENLLDDLKGNRPEQMDFADQP